MNVILLVIDYRTCITSKGAVLINIPECKCTQIGLKASFCW